MKELNRMKNKALTRFIKEIKYYEKEKTEGRPKAYEWLEIATTELWLANKATF